jgi:hypothetical protein
MTAIEEAVMLAAQCLRERGDGKLSNLAEARLRRALAALTPTCICGTVHHGDQPPHAVEGAELTLDGASYMVLAGENLQEGVAGFGTTPEEACLAFDREWREVSRG